MFHSRRPLFGSLLCAAVLLSSALTAEEPETPKLRLETGGHTGLCYWLQWTPDGKRIISGGADSVVKVWDVEDPRVPRLSQSIRLPFGKSFEGALFSGALSPDGRTLAVGRFPFGGETVEQKILLLDIDRGAVQGTLSGHEGVANDLAWSTDGRWLASASSDGRVRVWDFGDLGTLGFYRDAKMIELRGHEESVFRVEFLPRGNNTPYLISGSKDETSRMWERQAAGEWKTLRTVRGHSGGVMDVACSPDGRWVATSSNDRTIRFWDADGVFAVIDGIEQLPAPLNHAITFTPDSRSIVLAGMDYFGGSAVWPVPGGKVISSFYGHDNAVYDVQPHPHSSQRLVASTGGNGNGIILWNTQSGRSHAWIVGSGSSIFDIAVASDGRRIAFGSSNIPGLGHLSGFSLEDFCKLSRVGKEDVWSNSRVSLRGLSAKRDSESANTLLIFRSNRLVSRITRPEEYDRIRSYSFINESQVAVGSDSRLTLHDVTTGRLLREFSGHVGQIWSVVASPDGQTLFSSGVDQTIRAWRLEDLNASYPDSVSPLLNFFFPSKSKDRSGNKEWIAWTEEGYYACSPGADRFIGWQTNRGIDKVADFAAAWQYRKVFYRPEVVELVYTARSTERAIQLAALARRSRPEDLVDIEEDHDKLALPRVTVESPKPSARIEAERVRLTGRVTPTGSHPITDIRVTVNKRPVAIASKDLVITPRPGGVPLAFDVPLLPGDNLIEVLASTQFATSEPYRIQVRREVPGPLKPSLYFLGIACAEYEVDELSLKFPDDDARGIAAALKSQQGELYEQVNVTTLIDEQVTERNIRRALKQLRSDVTQNDMAIVFISGHGHSEPEGSYFFCPHDIDPEEPAITGVRWTEITEPLKILPCKVVLLMDTCHAGGVLGPQTARRAKLMQGALTRAIADLVAVEAGVVVLTSSMGREPSYEAAEWGHGAFALSAIEALTGRHKFAADKTKTRLPADLNGDGVLEITEIDAYITARVKELTGGKQHPVTNRGDLPSFPLATSR